MDVGVSSIAAMIARSRRWCTGGGIWNRCPWTKVATEREELVNLNPGAWRPRRRDGGIFTLKFTERPFRPRPGILKVGTRREQPLSRLLPLRPPRRRCHRGRAGPRRKPILGETPGRKEVTFAAHSSHIAVCIRGQSPRLRPFGSSVPWQLLHLCSGHAKLKALLWVVLPHSLHPA